MESKLLLKDSSLTNKVPFNTVADILNQTPSLFEGPLLSINLKLAILALGVLHSCCTDFPAAHILPAGADHTLARFEIHSLDSLDGLDNLRSVAAVRIECDGLAG